MEFETDKDAKSSNLQRTIKILAENKVPLDIKGSEAYSLQFEVEDESNLVSLLTAMEGNTAFKGSLTIISSKFKDVYGHKIINIIKNNSLRSLKIWNRTHPFSDRIATNIGDAAAANTSLEKLIIFIDTGDFSPIHLAKFLNTSSRLRTFGYLKVTNKLFQTFAEFLNKNAPLKELLFYYDPLKEVNLLYEKEVTEDALNALADKIQNESNVVEVNIIPLQEKFQEDINEKLTNDMIEINNTLKFSCEIVKKEKASEIFTDKTFAAQNKVMDNILEKIDRDDGKKLKNSIVSVRSYIDRAIGESLNEALYDLEVQRERNPNKTELFTAKGSIRYVSQYLLDNKKK